MAALTIAAIGGSIINATGKVIGGIQRGKAAIAEGQARQRAAIENAKRLEEQADFVELQTDEEIARFRRVQSDVEGTIIAESGASGLKLSGSALAVIQSNAVNAQRDVDIIRLTGSRQSTNLRTEADFILEEGQFSLSNAEMRRRAERIGGFFGAVGEGSKLIPNPFLEKSKKLKRGKG